MVTKEKKEESVQVVVRVRPMSDNETKGGYHSCLTCDSENDHISIQAADENTIPTNFTFDAVYDTNSLQQSVYDEVAFPLVESMLEGYNCTIFAYGQTGCGKTHTMMGEPATKEGRGIIPNCFDHIFGCMDEKTAENAEIKYLVRCSYLEIYKEDVFDLLTEVPARGQPKQKLDVREDPGKGFYVADLKWAMVNSVQEMEKAMNFGNNNRKTAATKMNARSSRSHSIFQVYLETAREVDGKQFIKAGKLNLVDLAGSERSSKTGATGETLKEGILINKSLMTLGNVITALCSGKNKHIPYRDSNLTRLLQDSLGGNTKTLMIAALSPANYNYEETMSTLRYANRAKQIKNKPKVNEDPKDALLKQYEGEIKQLKDMLQQMQSHSGNSGQSSLEMIKELQALRKQQELHDKEMKQLAMTSQAQTLEPPEAAAQASASKVDDNGSQASARKPSTIEEFSVSELIAQLQKQGKRVNLVDIEEQPSMTNLQDAVSRVSQPDAVRNLADQMANDSQPSLVENQARTGTFGGAQLDGTIKEGYQLNAFETPEEEEAALSQAASAISQPSKATQLVAQQPPSRTEETHPTIPPSPARSQAPKVAVVPLDPTVPEVKDKEVRFDPAHDPDFGPGDDENGNGAEDSDDGPKRQLTSEELDDQAAKHIENFIMQMEKKIVGGGGGTGPSVRASQNGLPSDLTDTPAEDSAAAAEKQKAAADVAKSFKAKRERNKALKNKKKLKQEETEARQQQEEEMLLADDLNEREETQGGDQAAEIDRLRAVNRKLRQKYQAAAQESKVLEKEHDTGKNELLDIIRMQEKDIKFNEKIVQIMLTENDQYKLRDRSTWDEDARDWTVPLFILHKMQDEVAFPTIGAKARVEQARVEREIHFHGDAGYRDASNPRSRPTYLRDNFSEQDGEHDLHDPDMQWHKFGAKGSGGPNLTKNQNKSSQMSSGGGDNGSSSMRRTVRNDNTKIDGVHDRRNKYLGNGGKTATLGSSDINDGTMDRQKPYSKHLMPISPNGSTGRALSTNPTVASPAPGDSRGPAALAPLQPHPLQQALSPAGGRGGIKPLGSIDHGKHKARLAGLSAAGGGQPVARFRNLEPINKFQ